MKNLMFLILLLSSCNENHSFQRSSADQVGGKDSLQKSDSIPEDDLPSITDEEKQVFELIEIYKKSGDAKHLQGVLDYWKSGLKEEYIPTFTPLYCGLVSELMGDKNEAKSYYKQSKDLALDRITKPLDDIEFEYGVKTEKELIQQFELSDSKFDLKVFKANKIKIQKYWLLLSQIALGEDKFNDVKGLKMNEMDLTFPFLDFEINKREDIFMLITGCD